MPQLQLDSKLKNTFGPQKGLKIRDCTPSEAVNMVGNLLDSGKWKMSEIAAELGLSKSSVVSRYLNNISKLQLANLSLYLTDEWSESINVTKRTNRLSLTTMGEFAAFAKNGYSQLDVSKALHLSIKYSFGKSNMINTRQLIKLHNIETLEAAIELENQERRLFNPNFKGDEEHLLVATIPKEKFSIEELNQAKEEAEKIIGPIVDYVNQHGSLVAMGIIPGKINQSRLLELYSPEHFERTLKRIKGRK